MTSHGIGTKEERLERVAMCGGKSNISDRVPFNTNICIVFDWAVLFQLKMPNTAHSYFINSHQCRHLKAVPAHLAPLDRLRAHPQTHPAIMVVTTTFEEPL